MPTCLNEKPLRKIFTLSISLTDELGTAIAYTEASHPAPHTMTTAQLIRKKQITRKRSLEQYPSLRKNTAHILRSLRNAFHRPAWIEPCRVPAMIYAMAEQTSALSHLFPHSRLDRTI